LRTSQNKEFLKQDTGTEIIREQAYIRYRNYSFLYKIKTHDDNIWNVCNQRMTDAQVMYDIPVKDKVFLSEEKV
jgi:hypothetical protein